MITTYLFCLGRQGPSVVGWEITSPSNSYYYRPVSAGLSITYRASHRKARDTHREEKTALQAEQQHDVNSAGHTVTEGRRKRGARHCCFGQCRSDELYLEKFKKLHFFHFPMKFRGLQNLNHIMCSIPRSDLRCTHMICICKAKGAELAPRNHGSAYSRAKRYHLTPIHYNGPRQQ